MTTKQVIIAFLVLYLILMGVGGAMYYAIVTMPQGKTKVETHKEGLETANKIDAQETDKNKVDKAVEETAKKELTTADVKQTKGIKKADETSAQKSKEKRAKLEKLKASIEEKLKTVTKGSVTFYTSNRETELSGVHLRPFIAESKGNIILKNDIYYYSALDDANYGWIHGSNLDVTADGQTFSFAFDTSKRRDKLGKGAEDLMENYVFDADKNAEEMLKAVANATNVTVHYYGEADIVCALSREDIRHINDIMTYYDILSKEANGDM